MIQSIELTNRPNQLNQPFNLSTLPINGCELS
jgi:hypothetical protein